VKKVVSLNFSKVVLKSIPKLILKDTSKLVRKLVEIVVLSTIMFFGTGCATTQYTTHYGFFEAENSAGELRQFRVLWETAIVQDWGERRRYTGPVVLEAQCSQRKMVFFDDAYPAQRACVSEDYQGIVYCGDVDADRDQRGLGIEPGSICAEVTDARGSKRISRLDSEIRITNQCQPAVTEIRKDGKVLNQDYLMPSKLPYVIATTTLKGRDRDGHVPQLWNHSSVCDPLQAR
jgi:hypothetical protein